MNRYEKQLQFIYIPSPFSPVCGVANNPKEQQKQWWSHSSQPSLDGTTGATQPTLPRLPQLMSLHRCHLPYCPYHRVTSIRPSHGNSRCQSELSHNHSPLIHSLASLTSILPSFRALLTPSIHPNLRLPLALLPLTFAFIIFFNSRSLSILST